MTEALRAIRLRTPRLELRLPTEAELRRIVEHLEGVEPALPLFGL